MKIYFAASIRGGRDDQAIYAQLIENLKQYGTVLTEHFASDKINPLLGTGKDSATIYAQDIAWISEADCIVAEVTQPSLGVGFEIAYAALHLHKPVLCLYRPQKEKALSAMIAGCPSVTYVNYHTAADLSPIFTAFFAQLKKPEVAIRG